MLQIKSAAGWIMPLTLLLSIPVARAQQGVDVANSATPAQLSFASSSKSGLLSDSSSDSAGYVRLPPAPAMKKVKKGKEGRSMRPFTGVAIAFKADTLGTGAEVATPFFRSFNLRSSVNAFAFTDPFSIDGVSYDARLHFRSAQASLDWFPTHRSFHISPGILYMRNNLTAPSSVPAGRYFELGDQGFINSVDDPLTGSSSVIFPRKIAPMLTIGKGNLIPRTGRHLSIPFEVGAAYTGAAQINVTLNGTACTNQGCVTFADNAEAQASLKQEINKLNRDLAKVPIYPVVSVGLGYRF